MIVIGLTGRIGAGKSAVADHLVAEYGYTKLSFAGPLKKMLRTLDPIVGSILMTEAGKLHKIERLRLSQVFEYCGSETEVKNSKWGPEYRRLMQVLGTDCIRAVDENFWVRAAVAQLTDPEGKYVFDDVRFPNEADSLRRVLDGRRILAHGTLWRVVRPGYETDADHASEQHAETIPVDEILMNVSTMETLKTLVDEKIK